MEGRFALALALAALRRPGAPPPRWTLQGLALGGAWLGSTILTICLSVMIYGNPAHLFGEHRLGTFASVAMLFGAAFASLRVARRLGADPFSRLWRVGAVALVLLGLDDLFMLHEGVDWTVHQVAGWDPKDPVTGRIGDVIVITYPFGAALAAWPWRARLATLSWMLWSLVIAMATFSAMAAIDWFDASKVIEESLKIAAGAAIFAGILAADGALSERQRRVREGLDVEH